MEVKELRVGNYLKPKHLILKSKNIEFLEVLTISPQNGMDLKSYFIEEYPLKSSYIYGKWDSVEPIELTEEWLVKLGFKQLCNDFQKNGVIIHTRKRGFVLRKSVPIIKYVHQLQNLYHALTGEELTMTQQ